MKENRRRCKYYYVAWRVAQNIGGRAEWQSMKTTRRLVRWRPAGDMYVLLPKCLMYASYLSIAREFSQCVLHCNGKYACLLNRPAAATCVTFEEIDKWGRFQTAVFLWATIAELRNVYTILVLWISGKWKMGLFFPILQFPGARQISAAIAAPHRD